LKGRKNEDSRVILAKRRTKMGDEGAKNDEESSGQEIKAD
jgi:hypothetical protein